MLNKKDCLQQIQIFFWIIPFSNLLRKTNFTSISLFLYEGVTFLIKRKVFSEFPWKCLKKGQHSLAICGSLWGEKQVLLIFVPFYWFDQIQLFKQIQIFLRISHLSNLLRKTNFLSISVLLTEIVNCLIKKREVFSEFTRKCFKTTEKHSLAVCGSLWGEKPFLLIIVPFYLFDQKHLLKEIQIFLRIWPFSNLLKKTNFLSISVLLSEIVIFLTKKRNFQ